VKAPTPASAADRRAEYRALAINPAYEPLARWTCPTCSAASPRSATRCSSCGSMGPAWMPEGAPAQLERPVTPRIVRVGTGGREGGQSIVEFAIVMPILMLLLLGIAAVGIYQLAAVQQASASNTIAGWSAANPAATEEERDSFTQAVTACPVTAVYSAELVTVTVRCPTIAGQIVPALPTTITTVATGYVPSPTP
jgi:hypothetical protein